VERLDLVQPSLVDLSDPLLDLGDDAVPIAGDPVRLAFVLGAGGGLELDAGPARVASLRHARAGGDELWLALGMFAYGARVAPVALWPVELADDGRLIHARGRAPRVNDALVAQLAADGVELALAPADDDSFDLAALLARATAVADARGWRVDRAARVAVLSFARFDIARDVTGITLDSEPLRQLRGDMTAAALPAVLPVDLIAPLDADSAQLAAIAAAGTGASYVVQGAPGTGKTQTIVNVIAHCASAGKSVLVVSDRASALDVVLRRLAGLGLADFCLPIYGDHATSAHALTSLGRGLDRAFRPAAARRVPRVPPSSPLRSKPIARRCTRRRRWVGAFTA
jgi:hypothetical protein